MAISNPSSPEPAPTTLRRASGDRVYRAHGLARVLTWVARGLGLLVVIGAGAVALNWHWLNAEAAAGTAYGAHVGCACHFIAGRSLADCRKDFEPGMELVSLSADESTKQLTARFVPLASQTATWRPDTGCVLQRWR